MSRYTREIHTRPRLPKAPSVHGAGELRRAVRWARFWRWVSNVVGRREHTAHAAVQAAAFYAYRGENPAYRCTCRDCWHALADDLANGKIDP